MKLNVPQILHQFCPAMNQRTAVPAPGPSDARHAVAENPAVRGAPSGALGAGCCGGGGGAGEEHAQRSTSPPQGAAQAAVLCQLPEAAARQRLPVTQGVPLSGSCKGCWGPHSSAMLLAPSNIYHVGVSPACPARCKHNTSEVRHIVAVLISVQFLLLSPTALRLWLSAATPLKHL